jgi:hypothetical protein
MGARADEPRESVLGSGERIGGEQGQRKAWDDQRDGRDCEMAGAIGRFRKGSSNERLLRERRLVLLANRMSTLRSRLQALAGSFANEVVATIRRSSLEELVSHGSVRSASARGAHVGRSTAHAVASDAAEKNSDALKRLRSGGRLARRSPKAIAEALARIIALVKQHKEGLRAEQIREQLGMHPKEMPRVLKEGLSSKRLRAKGYKRATTYFA